MDSSSNGQAGAVDNVVALPQQTGEEGVSSAGVARHRRHRFPGRTESVRARYDRDELAAVAAAAERAGLTTSGYVAAAALAAASSSEPPDASGDRELLGELLQARLAVRRYAVNVNQGIASLNSGAGAPVWLERAVAGCDRAVSRLDELTVRLLQRRS
jgi:hypothetical protein